jgi:hypothetical protein
MSLGRSRRPWPTLVVAVILAGCRARTPPTQIVDWRPEPGAKAETAALLLVDGDGMSKLTCLPARARGRQPFPGVALGRILDAAWKEGPMIAALPDARGEADPSLADDLVLLVPHRGPRRVATGVRSARFSPDATALAYEVVRPRLDGAGLPSVTSYVLELASGAVRELGALAEPLWEPDSKHVRATGLRTGSDRSGRTAGNWTSLRVRWDRESGTATVVGPGSAQIPAPAGSAVAWSEKPRRTHDGPSECAILVDRLGFVPHLIVGPFCMGIADDRAVRWSPDGRWLAFPHPGPLPGQRKPGGFFVDVVSAQGGRYPALSALFTRARPEPIAIATAPRSVWFDWSPSGRFLALEDGASDLRVYDFDAQGIASLGEGRRPMWSPGGSYLLILADAPVAATTGGSARQAFALPGVAATARIDLGLVRDARWLPAQACEGP